jgi:predicted nucleotide-binding protein
MILKELQILTEALWEAIKTDPKFFSSINSFSRKLAEYNYSQLMLDQVKEIQFYANKIEVFFNSFNLGPGVYYSIPNEIADNEENVKRINELINLLAMLDSEQLKNEVETIKLRKNENPKEHGKIFIGHGRNKIWARLQVFLNEDLNLETFSFESESRTSEPIVEILNKFLDSASFAILVLTAEDETGNGKKRARQNVIHEAGLFQGRLGFNKVILLKEDQTEDFSNIAGLQYISFTGDNIEQTFYELNRYLKKQGLIK